jgi:hypothetical protein
MDVDLEMTIKYVGIYNQNKAKGITMIPDCEVAKRVMMNVYNSYVFYKLLTPIESLPIEEKKSLTNECREVKDSNYTNERLRMCCRILHLIRFFNKKTNEKGS